VKPFHEADMPWISCQKFSHGYEYNRFLDAILKRSAG
jgi:hypothetical protein